MSRSARPRRFASPLPALWAALLAMSLASGLGGCDRTPPPSPGAATEPVQAVAVLSRHLRDNDLQAFAHDAVPPSVRPGLTQAWLEGRTRWPLEELPFDHKIPGMLAGLSARGAETGLQRSFDRQFANAGSELSNAARTLGLFGAKYLASDQALSADERRHYIQLVTALGEWGAGARLGDPRRAHPAIQRLAAAARRAGIDSEADFRALGMDESLRRLGPLVAATKESLRGYGLDLDLSLDGMQLALASQSDADHARVRMRYPLAGRVIDTEVAVERVEGRWYVSDFLRHARAAASASGRRAPGLDLPSVVPAPPAPDAPAQPVPTPGQPTPAPASS